MLPPLPLPLPLDPPEQPATAKATDAAAAATIVQRFTVAVLPCPVSPYQPNWFRPMRTSVVHTTVEVKDDAESMPAFVGDDYTPQSPDYAAVLLEENC
ncbi:MAG TPA: hypothetical protein VGN81_28315 [Pseudonocardiaceae bacterium]